MTLTEKRHKATQRIVGGASLFICAFAIIGIFVGSGRVGAQPSWGNLDKKPALQPIQQSFFDKNVAFWFNSEKKKGEKSPSLPVTIKDKGKKTKAEKFGTFPFLIFKSSFICKKLPLRIITRVKLSCQISYLNFCLQPRAPPYTF